MQVAKTFHHLLEVVSGVLFIEPSAEGNEIEEFTATDKFEDDVLDMLACLLFGVLLDSFTNFDHIYNVLVLDLG